LEVQRSVPAQDSKWPVLVRLLLILSNLKVSIQAVATTPKVDFAAKAANEVNAQNAARDLKPATQTGWQNH
jgi:hypothetical protein